MKRKLLFLITALLGVFLFTCSPKFNPGTSSDSLTAQLKLLSADWEKMEVNPEVYNNDNVGYRGVRLRYSRSHRALSKAIVQRIVGEPVFLSGPHEKDINFYSTYDFGRYNPKFLSRLKAILTQAYQNKLFVQRFQPFYDQELKRYLRTYHHAYAAAANRRDIKKGYQARINDPSAFPEEEWESNPSIFLQESFRDFAEQMEGEGFDVYESFTCPGFWVRRSIDGTAGAFYEILALTMGAFDAGYLENEG